MDIAHEMYPEVVTCYLDRIKHDEQLLQDTVDKWKRSNRPVLIYSLDNFINDAPHIEKIRSQYEKFAFTTPGVHKNANHISNVDYLTRWSCDQTQPMMHHETPKKYHFVFLVGKLHAHRMHLLESLSKKGLLELTLMSLRNPEHAYEHLLPKLSVLPKEYEWPAISEIGDFQAGWHSDDSPMAVAFNKNIGKVHHKLYTDTAYSIVSETNTNTEINYITEKTWTPIIAEHLVIAHGNKGNNYFLEQLGFVVLNDFIPHYDESDHNIIADICENLSKQAITSVYKHTQTQRQHNRQLALDEEHWKKYHRQQLKSCFG